MSKLVDSPVTVRPFLPKLLHGLIKVEGTIGDPEVRSVVGPAISTLRQVGEVPTGDASDLPPVKSAEAGQLCQLRISIYKKAGANPVPSIADDSAMYVARLAANLVNAKNFDVPEWDTLAYYLGFLAQTPDPVRITHDWVSAPRRRTPVTMKSSRMKKGERTFATASFLSRMVPRSCSTPLLSA